MLDSLVDGSLVTYPGHFRTWYAARGRVVFRITEGGAFLGSWSLGGSVAPSLLVLGYGWINLIEEAP